jgi:hypothetical protein
MGFVGLPPITEPPTNVFSPPNFMLVKVDRTDITIPGFPPSIVPIAPVDFTCSPSRGRNVKLRQFPVTLAFAITDYKCQGKTYNSVVLDLAKPRTGNSPPASPYVQLSRARSLDNVVLLRPFDVAELRTPLSDELIAELDWQRHMHRETLQTSSWD